MIRSAVRRLIAWGHEDAPSRPLHEIVFAILQQHFAPTALPDLVITERTFPSRVRADVQRAIDDLVRRFDVLRFLSPHREYHQEDAKLQSLMVYSEHYPAVASAPEYEEVDIGEAEPVRCLKEGFGCSGVVAAMHMHQAER